MHPSSGMADQTEAETAISAGTPDDVTLVRLMRSLDGGLSREEQALLDAEMREHPHWHDVKADMARGTRMAQLAFADTAAPNSDRAGDRAPCSLDAYRATKARRTSWFLAGYRQAAAIVLGFALGAGAMAGGYTILQHGEQDAGLRLAGIASAPGSEDLQQHVLARALMPLLSADYGADRRVRIQDTAAGLNGNLSIDRGFQLGQNIPCVEFTFAPRDSDSTPINGIACQQPTGGWQVMTITANR